MEKPKDQAVAAPGSGVHSVMIGAPQVHQAKEQGEEQEQGSDGPFNPGCLSSLVFLLPPQRR